MGGEDKEKNITKVSEKHGHVQNIFDTSMSRLLQDFNSAELLHNATEISKATNSCHNSDCETVVTSMKHLHLRRPAINKQRKGRINALKKKTSPSTLNLAIAACGFQRPIVWPARLSNHNEKCSSNVLRPSRLSVSKKDLADKGTKPSVSTCSSESQKLSERQDCIIFGNVSSADSLSFSSLCEQGTQNHKDSQNVQDNMKCHTIKQRSTISSTVKTLCKRQSTSDAPPAKFARTFAEDNQLSTEQTVFLDYRIPGSSYSCDTGCDSACELSLVTDTNKRCTSNAILCTEQAAPSPSRLETVATLGIALTSCDLSVAHSSSDDLNQLNSHEPTLEETNVNELASYFDDLLHIPRKMSVMAEMMYA